MTNKFDCEKCGKPSSKDYSVHVEGREFCAQCYLSCIFVFGSNLAGRHGMGSAKDAWRYKGAELGVGKGITGQSYAIPTKGFRMEVLPLYEIEGYCKEFVQYTKDHPDLLFRLTRIGCGLAGYTDDQMAPCFRGVDEKNVIIPERWRPYLCPTIGASATSSTPSTDEPFDITTRVP